MNDLFRILELPPDDNETLAGEEWRWNDATWASGLYRAPGWTWRQRNGNGYVKWRKAQKPDDK